MRLGRHCCYLKLNANALVDSRLAGEDELAGNHIHGYMGGRWHLAVQDLLRELVLDLALHCTTQWTSTKGRVEADLDQLVLGSRGEL